MFLALSLLVLTYAGIAFGLAMLFLSVPSWWPYWVAITVALAASVVAQYRSPEQLLLRSVGATIAPRESEPEVYGVLERLALITELPIPRLARVSANRDAVVMTATSAPRTIGTLLVGGEGVFLWFLVWPLALPIWAVGTLLTLTVSRYREYATDRGSALITGAPEQLMSALQKLSDEKMRIPRADLRWLTPVEALWIVPNAERRLELLMDHPPLEKRMARLAALAREIATPST